MDIWNLANQKQQRLEMEEMTRYQAIDRTLIDRDHEVEELKEKLFETRLTAAICIAIMLIALFKAVNSGLVS